MAFLKTFFKWLTNQKPTKDRVLTHLGDEQEWNQEKKELVKYVSSLEGQLAKSQADKRVKPIKDKLILDEVDLIKELKSKSDKIEHKKYEGLYSLNSLFTKLDKNKKFKVEITDKDDSTVFDYFKSFVVIPTESGANIGIKGKSGEVWAEGKTLSHIIWKPETLGTQIRRKRIQLAYDKDFNFIPDLEKVRMNEIKYDDDDGEFYESEEVMRPFKEMLIEKIKEVNTLIEDKAYLEKANELSQKKIQQMERLSKVSIQRAEISDSETSKSMQIAIDSLKAIGGMARSNIILQDEKLTSDELKDKGEAIITELLETLEDEKSRTAVQKAKDDWRDSFTFAKKHAPTTIINEVSDAIQQPTKPGQQIGK